MFNFLHPRPLLDGRPTVVQIVQQKARARQDTRLLIVSGIDAATGTAPSSCVDSTIPALAATPCLSPTDPREQA